ncbi:MAG: hypothetical protein UR39_C0002G0069 [Candidatus Woesebacteria bacterium GW2011_GWA1_33_30]|uniref:Ribbon-helix-helix protein CopG domain-containing protein n=1 Tax=Candidatus Woesebacteria bacterium GW2011_GWA2_33_28 TaxID=1618561 RepID=A0A0G0A9E6_9BACT|nr:MAG: hypothetical protein UR38_C0002G0069 [Candidatus Woesebacteria bacterium GW2011_GWA2_33_28]KKP48779.1 MAG: hypothetical protein UR39_C0002G0069 [Candidatus Woesebacteria bacterium GW2011_GWA1_33_30]KKP50052.1 MAG: hypothetical protein UR40_C0002G0069 [Microgenomates group bacterium GW2011_GWC1_33_32]KKP51823.1 MAG: hypothetical protein UR44_C0006G0069 [Candidatus Woesebacteria bacterium GW2011_GWB1_33_38]KKP57823.1 MAG: hypothetical protein UR48_C0010G0013 [Microgenomates group bacteriu
MTRYQVYLNSGSVAVVDEVEEYLGISRSQIIRDLVDRYAQNILQIFSVTRTTPFKKSSLEALIGIINVDGQKGTNYAMKDDNKYLID